MSEPIRTAGAPFDQGLAQGLALASAVHTVRRDLSLRHGPFAWRAAQRRAHLRCGRPLQRFLPQLHERLRGIADGSGVGARFLELVEGESPLRGVGSAKQNELEARLELPAGLEPLLVLRQSDPDAVGFPSVELTAAHWPGCVGGVNEPGFGVIVVEERGACGPSLRSYAQDLLLRAEGAEVAADHLRLRAKLGGGDGALLAIDARGTALRLELSSGVLSVAEAAHSGAPVEDSTLRIDAAARELVWGERSLVVGA